KCEQINFTENTIHNLYNLLLNSFDNEFGGFGNAPKFPTPQNFIFLLDYALFYNSNTALELVEKSLFNMRLGGIFDQVGYGFHRYSTDRFWLLPHFEKMLYDQAGLLIAYSKTYKITKNNFFFWYSQHFH
ncbi:MAG: thioredoxin domain-containing protein, partial [Anaerolineales bacterium]